MNPNETNLKSLRDAIDAHLRGEPVQIKSADDGARWVDATAPTFSLRSFLWRPKPKEPRRFWIGLRTDDSILFACEKESEAKKISCATLYEVVEVVK